MNYSTRDLNKTVKFIIIHYTGMKSFEEAYKKLSHPRSDVSCHYLISRKGIIFNLLSTNLKAWHAGESEFCGRSNCNDFSIGIELEGTDFEPFTDAQYDSLVELSVNILKEFPNIDPDRIVGHSDVAPGRKTDPGPYFQWERYKALLGQELADGA